MQEMDNVAILNELNQNVIELDIVGNFATVAAATYNTDSFLGHGCEWFKRFACS